MDPHHSAANGSGYPTSERDTVAQLYRDHGMEPGWTRVWREGVDVTDEEEYFPPPRTLREVMPVLDTVAALATGGSPKAAAALGGSFSTDRAVNASDTLAALKG